MIRKAVFTASLLVLITSCSTREQAAQDTKKVRVFFDLHGYMQSLIERYTEEDVHVNKKVSLNDNSEWLENMEVDWKKEFQPLLQAHINRSAWKDKFRVDTLMADPGYRVHYLSDQISIPVHSLEVAFTESGDVQSIRIETRRNNLLYNSKQVIELEPDVAYRIEGSQRALFLSRTTFNVEADLLMNKKAGEANQDE